MSTSNKRSFVNDENSHQISTTKCIRKRFCLSIVPSVPRGGTNLTRSSSNEILSLSKEETLLDAGDQIF